MAGEFEFVNMAPGGCEQEDIHAALGRQDPRHRPGYLAVGQERSGPGREARAIYRYDQDSILPSTTGAS